jgi:2-methylcitrate dehydratase PrpD
MSEKHLNILSDFVHEFRLSDLDTSMVQHVKDVIRDTIGVIVAGSNESQIAMLYEFFKKNSSLKEGTVFGKKQKISSIFSAMINGAAGSTKELEEGNSLVFGHPAIQIFPAAISAGEIIGATGKKVIEGFVSGYEVAGRISRASKIRQGFHPSGTWGTIGAAIATAKIMELSSDDTLSVMNIASSFSIASNVENSFFGNNISEMYAAHSNYFGILAYQLFRCGFSAAPNSILITFGKLISDDFSKEVVLKDIGDKFLINKNYIKMHPSCRFSHSALDALEKVLKTNPIDPKKVERVEIRTYSQALHLDNRNPKNSNAVRFSLPFLIAIYLLNRKLDDDDILSFNQRINDIKNLSDRVTLIEEESFNRDPLKRPTGIKIYLSTGEVFESFVENCLGGDDYPFKESELLEKFKRLSTDILGKESCEKLILLIMGLEKIDNIQKITNLLRTN